MSLFNTLNTGASGLGVSSRGLAVIGDNIANLNTIGYKSGRASFADAMPQSIGTLSGASQLGNGALTSDVAIVFGQGMLQDSGSPLDVAIQGRGFFEVANEPESFYTRDGSFHVDTEGYMVNAQGLRVQGYQASDGALSTANGDVHIDTSGVPPLATTSITLNMNLGMSGVDSATEPLAALIPGLTGAPNGTTIQELSTDADYSTSVNVYDSLGESHVVSIFFEATGTPNEWTWVAAVDGETVNGGAALDGAIAVADGTMSFGSTGGPLLAFNEANNTSVDWPGADPFTFNMEVGLDAAGNVTDGSITQTAGDSTVTQISQDGRTVGDLTSVNVDAEGIITGSYTNGEELQLGQLTLALFEAESGLERMGGNLWRATIQSGQAAMGVAGTGGRGSTVGYALERSNVELEEQFVNMIQTQRSYQANAGVVRTADETLQELVNLV